MKNIIKNIGIFLLIFVAIGLMFTFGTGTKTQTEKIGLERLVTQVNEGKVQSIEVEKNNLVQSELFCFAAVFYPASRRQAEDCGIFILNNQSDWWIILTPALVAFFVYTINDSAELAFF